MLSGLSGLVVGALLDDDETNGPEDAFADALRRYREEGAPEVGAPWRMSATDRIDGDHAARILGRLARDLLEGLSSERRDGDTTDVTTSAPVEIAPPNVLAITDARQVPALEMASDGTWRPSEATVSADEADASARRRANVPSLGSRYPKDRRDRASGFVIPPAPPRFTQVTVAPVAYDAIPAPVQDMVAPRATIAAPERVGDAGAAAGTVTLAPAPTAAPPQRVGVSAESIIKAVAAGTEIVAGPFARFQQLAAFVKALRAIPGVQDVATRQFVRGTVHLRIRHSQAIALTDRIREMTEFGPQILTDTADRIELRVELPDDVPPARA